MLVIAGCHGTRKPGAKQSRAGKSSESAEPSLDRDKAAPVANRSNPVKPQPLSEEESAKLAARAQQPGPEVAGGALSNLHLTYIVIALAAAVLVLVLR